MKKTKNVRKIILAAVIAALSILLVVEADSTLNWKLPHDPSLMLYFGYLMHEFHYIPYRDFFEQNMIGTYVVYELLGSVTGFKEFFLRIADIGLLLILMANTFLFLRRINTFFALFAGILCGFGFFYAGREIALQREFFILVMLTSSLTIYSYVKSSNYRVALISILLGFCITIKPHSCIIYPLLLFSIAMETRKKSHPVHSIIANGAISLACLFMPLALMLAYLQTHGALAPFSEIATNYWKLYAHIDNQMTYREGADRTAYVIKEFLKFGGHSLLVLPAYFGYKFADEKKAKAAFILLTCLAVAFSLYPAVTGQFWTYYSFIFFYFILLLSAFSALPLFTGGHTGKFNLFIQWCLPAIVLLHILPTSYANTVSGPVPERRINRVDALVEYFRGRNVTKDTRVQPLEWVGGGVVHAMLLAGVKPATRFLEDFYFYHSLSDPFIHRLRNEFITVMTRNKPDYVVQITSEDKYWISGKGTSREFAELNGFIAKNYIADLITGEFTVFKCKKEN